MTGSWQQIVEKLIERAKEAVELAYDGRHSQRGWLDASLDSYQDGSNRVRLLVFEGSPAKGYIVANYVTGSVQAYNAWDERIALYDAHNMCLGEEIDEIKLR